jgi:hypothetical protein
MMMMMMMVMMMVMMMLKIGAESLRIRPEENISSSIINKEGLLHDVLEQGQDMQDQDFIWSLMYGLAHDQQFRLFVEPSFKIKEPDTYYEEFKSELNRWTVAQKRLNTWSGVKIPSKPEDSSSTVLTASVIKVRSSYCRRAGHSREDCYKRKTAEVDAGSLYSKPTRSQSPVRFKPRADRDPQRTEQIGYTDVDDFDVFGNIAHSSAQFKRVC